MIVTTSRKGNRAARKPGRYRLHLEQLEPRWLLATTPLLLTVNTALDDPLGPVSGAATLRDAINAVNAAPAATPLNPDVIQFAIGAGPQTIRLAADLPALGQNVVLDGTTQPGYAGVPLITVDGNNSYQLFNNPFTNVTLNSLLITRGYAAATGATGGAGGGVANSATMTLLNCVVNGNAAASDGGGLWNDGTLTAANCTFSNNTAGDNGGGIYNDFRLTLRQSLIWGNQALGVNGDAGTDGGDAGNGGGIYNSFSLTLTASTVAGNSATGTGLDGANGGASPVFNEGDNGGNGGSGGGIFNTGGSLHVNGSTISGNTALGTGGAGGNGGTGGSVGNFGGNGGDGGSGGGIDNISGSVFLTNSTVANNTAGGTGGNGGDGGTRGGLHSLNIGGPGGDGGSGAGINDVSGSVVLTAVTVAGNVVTGGAAGAGGAGGTGGANSTNTSGNAGNGGAGGGLNDSASGPGFLSLEDSLVATNSAPAGADIAALGIQADYSLIGDGSGIGAGGVTGANGSPVGNQVGTAASTINPFLGALRGNGGPTLTMALLPGSPAVGAGLATLDPLTDLPLTTDQRGFPRPGGPGTAVDVGAFQDRGYFLIPLGGPTRLVAVNQTFPLAVQLLEGSDDPLPGLTVTFTAQLAVGGATALLSTGSAVTDSNGQAALMATANNNTGGPYTVTAALGDGLSATFSLTNDQAPTITSAAGTRFVAGQGESFTVTTAGGFPGPDQLSESGALPAGVTFVDQGDGTASLSGIPGAGTGGAYTFTITAANQDNRLSSSQTFTLTVQEAPTITSAAAATFLVGQAGSFQVTTHGGFPAPARLSESGPLPAGVTFVDQGNGTATLSGIPGTGAGGIYSFTITAANQDGSAFSTQQLTLTVKEAPAVSSAAAATFIVGKAGNFLVTTRGGFPVPARLSESGRLPANVAFVDQGDGTASLSGTPAAGTAGTYAFTITAANQDSSLATTQAFTLTVQPVPTIFTSFLASANLSVPGQPVTLTATVVAVPASFGPPTGSIDFYDQTTRQDLGQVSLLGGVASLTTSALDATGGHTLSATYTNTDGSFVPPAQPALLTHQVQLVAREAGPAPGQTVLFVGGTSDNNHIDIRVRNGQVIVNFQCGAPEVQTPLAGLTALVVYNQGNDAHIRVGRQVLLPAFLFAGNGADAHVKGGGGPTVEVGGKGGSHLVGGPGRSILIAGPGGGYLEGKSGDDILIGGYTDFDTNLAALQAILTAWNSATSYTARTTALAAYLNTTTVHDDGHADHLEGGGGRAWYFALLAGPRKDRLDGVAANEIVVGIH